MEISAIGHYLLQGENKMNNLLEFKDKKVLITGASRGIGAKMAEVFGSLNAELLLCDLPSQQKILEEMASVLLIPQEKIHLYSVDVRDIGTIKIMMEQIKRDNLSVDVLINNAGINSYLSPFELQEKQWDDIMDVNLKGTFFMTRAVSEAFLIESKGNIISIASQHGVVANYNRVHYCASKAGIIQMTKALALEWSKFSVRVNCISPTFVETKENHNLLYESSFKRSALHKIPLKRYAQAEDIANAAVFLASPMAKMITGHNLIVDGGWTIY